MNLSSNATSLVSMVDVVYDVVMREEFLLVVRGFVPYHFLQMFLTVDSVALLMWTFAHLAIFGSFYAFANPIYTCINDNEAMYSVGSLILTAVMFGMALYHVPDLPEAQFNTREFIHYGFPAVVFTIPTLLLADVVMRITVKKTLIGSARACIGNLMLVVCCICTQYSYCLATSPKPSLVQKIRQVFTVKGSLGSGSTYCNMLDEPLQLPGPILITFVVLMVWSKLFGYIFRHGFILIKSIRHSGNGKRRRPSNGLNNPAGVTKEEACKAKEEEMKKFLENRPTMSSWYTMNLVYTLSFMFVQFKIFLGRFDVRTMRAALAGPQDTESTKPACPFKGKDELWFDFVADTGDGFNSTYSVARSLAQPHLNVKIPCPSIRKRIRQKMKNIVNSMKIRLESRRSRSLTRMPVVSDGETDSDGIDINFDPNPTIARQVSGHDVDGKDFGLPRGELLLHGGDLAYPHPSLECYEERLFRPYEAAFSPPPGANLVEVASKVSSQSSLLAQKYSSPRCWMIPGNHDWFDGLEAFLHTICGRHWFGGWHLPQTNTYWSIELPHRWFVLGFDLGLNDDLDDLQYSYFSAVVANLPPNANVIGITHAPHWHNDSYFKKETCRMHRQILGLVGSSRLRMLLAGDIHHYSRYSPTNTDDHRPELVISGGGGAFLHPTHYNVEVTGYERTSVYPSPVVSKALAWRNPFQFRRRNWAFEVLLGCAMLLAVLPALPLCEDADAAFAAWADGAGLIRIWCKLVLQCYIRIFETTNVALVMQVIIVFVFANLPEAQWGQLRQLCWGVPFGFTMSLCSVGVACSLELALMELGVPGHQEKRGSQADPANILLNLPSPWNDVGVWAVRSALDILDLPTHLYHRRAAVCSAGVTEAPRSSFVFYDALMLPYFWVLIAPTATGLFGFYLALASLSGRHMDEAFSSLRIENHKNFLRMHIDTDGNLHVYSIGIDRVAREWKEDPMWRPTPEKENELEPSRISAQTSWVSAQTAAPSRWIPQKNMNCTLVDYVNLPARRLPMGERARQRLGSRQRCASRDNTQQDAQQKKATTMA